jgi:SAM-dependent methyltransferase
MVETNSEAKASTSHAVIDESSPQMSPDAWLSAPISEVVPRLETLLKIDAQPSAQVVESLVSRLIAEGDDPSARSEIKTLEAYIFPLMAKASLEDQRAILSWIVPNFSQIPSGDIVSIPFIAKTMEFARRSPDKDTLFQALLDTAYQQKEKYHYRQIYAPDIRIASYSARQLSEVDDLMEAITHRDLPTCLRAISLESDPSKIKTLLGMCVDRDSLPYVTQELRNVLQKGDVDDEQKKQLEAMGKLLVGIPADDERPFFTALEDLYANLHFEDYPTNAEATPRDIAKIKKQMHAAGLVSSDGTLVEFGCGTGRLTNALVNEEGVARVIGIDPSPANLLTATEQGPKNGDVEYHTGTFEENNLPNNSVDIAIAFGRTPCHLRGYEALKKAFSKAGRALKSDGIFLFDLPDPNKGVYLENRKRYIQILRNLDIPLPADDEEVLPFFDWVVDSPDNGKSLFDRYVPDMDKPVVNAGPNVDLKTKLGNDTGFIIEEFAREPIDGWEGAENIYYMAKKVTQPQTLQLAA